MLVEAGVDVLVIAERNGDTTEQIDQVLSVHNAYSEHILYIHIYGQHIYTHIHT